MNQSPPNYSWDTPQRQSPAAIFIMLLKAGISLIKMFWIVLVFYFFKKRNDPGDSNLFWIVCGFGILTVGAAILKYWFSKFYIENDNFIIQTGWLKKKTVTIPIRNIQAVHLQQNVWQQFLKVTKVSIDSAGTETEEGSIDALPVAKAEQLKLYLLPLTVRPEEEALHIKSLAKEGMHLSLTDLMKLSLSANHLEAFFILFGLGINLLDDLKKLFNVDGWNVIGDYAGRMQSQKVLAVSMLIIFVAIVSTLISVIRTSLKYYDFKLSNTPQGWKISFGLINRQQFLLPYNKIQILSFRANLIRRKIDFWILHVQAIGYDEVKRKQHVNIPVVKLEQVISLSEKYQHSPVFNPNEGSTIKSSWWKRKLIFVGTPVTIILSVIMYLIAGLPGLLTVLVFPLLGLYYYTWFKNFRWKTNEEGIQMFSGVWGRRYTLLTWNKIQQLELVQGLYQKKNHLADIKFITAGGSAHLRYISFQEAQTLYNKILFIVESRNSNWM